MEWLWVLLSACVGLIVGWYLRVLYDGKSKATKSVVVDTDGVGSEIVIAADRDDDPTYETVDEREWRAEQQALAKKGRLSGSN